MFCLLGFYPDPLTDPCLKTWGFEKYYWQHFQSLGWEDPLVKGTATYSSILAWIILWTISSMGLLRVGHDRATFTFVTSELC